jgi:hypothetical protein
MSNAIVLISFNLAKGASVPDFLEASEKLNHEYMSKQKGYISWKQLIDGDTWVDMLTWETMEDAKKVIEAGASEPNPLAEKFYTFIDLESVKLQLYSVEKSY